VLLDTTRREFAFLAVIFHIYDEKQKSKTKKKKKKKGSEDITSFF